MTDAPEEAPKPKQRGLHRHARQYLVLINTLGLLAGIALMILGFAARRPEMFEKLVKKMFENGEIPAKVKSLIELAITKGQNATMLVIICGIIFFAFSLLGSAGACCNNKLSMKLYNTIFSIITVLIVVCVGLAFYKTKTAMRNR